MYPMMFPAEPSVEVFINGSRIGLLQEYSVAIQTDVRPLRGFGSGKAAAIHSGATSYTVKLKRLLLDRLELPHQPMLYFLEDFTLEIKEQQRGLRFQGCQWALIKENYCLGQTILEELELVATDFTPTALA